MRTKSERQFFPDKSSGARITVLTSAASQCRWMRGRGFRELNAQGLVVCAYVSVCVCRVSVGSFGSGEVSHSVRLCGGAPAR